MNQFQRYLDTIARVNSLSGPVTWYFYPGMLQDSPEKWWGDFGRRATPHEGIDISLFRSGSGPLRTFTQTTCIPAMARGWVKNICDDFIGTTLVTVLDPEALDPVLFVYAHLNIHPSLSHGSQVEPGQIIAQVATPVSMPPGMQPHLHLSCVQVSQGHAHCRLDWSLFADRNRATLINPVFQ
jgi:hypothetical protein